MPISKMEKVTGDRQLSEDPKMSEMSPRGRLTTLALDPEDWASLGLAFLALGALVVAVIATKSVPGKGITASTEAPAS